MVLGNAGIPELRTAAFPTLPPPGSKPTCSQHLRPASRFHLLGWLISLYPQQILSSVPPQLDMTTDKPHVKNAFQKKKASSLPLYNVAHANTRGEKTGSWFRSKDHNYLGHNTDVHIFLHFY